MGWTAPPTFTVGEVFTSTAANQLIGNGGDLSYLFGDLNWTTISSFTNGWSSTGACAYRKVGTLALLRGGVTGGSANTAAFTLPAGLRPTQAVTLIQAIPGGGSTIVVVNSSGTVVPFTSPGAGVALDGSIFSVDV